MSRIGKNRVEGGMQVSKRACTSISKAFHIILTYPKDKTRKKYNFECTFFTKISNKRKWTNESVTYRLGHSERPIKWYANRFKTYKEQEYLPPRPKY